MAPIAKSLALFSALFAALSTAAPVNLNKRDDAVVWDTVTTVVWTTIDITTTIYPDDSATTVSSTSTSTVALTNVQPTTTAAATSTTEQAAPSQQEEQVQQAASTTQAAATTTSAASTTTAAPQVASSASSTTEAAQSTTTQVAVVAQSSTSTSSSTSSSGYSGSCSQESPCVGDITYYDTATSASAPSSCGDTNDGETEAVLALPVGIMTDSDCGKTVTVTYNGVSKTGLVVDKCMGCSDTSIDLSRFFFGELADLSAGRISGVSWYIN